MGIVLRSSSAASLSSRATWRPSAGSASSQASTASRATAVPTVLAPRHRTFAWLCSLASLAVVASGAWAARIARDLVGRDRDADAGAADRDAEVRVAVGDLAADRRAVVGVVDRALGAVAAKVDHVEAPVLQVLGDRLLERDARVVRGDRDPHRAEPYRGPFVAHVAGPPYFARAARPTHARDRRRRPGHEPAEPERRLDVDRAARAHGRGARRGGRRRGRRPWAGAPRCSSASTC